MTTMRECVEKLSSEIGARPVGTDEEQNAAFFIEDSFNKETNFEVELQEFNATEKPELARVIPAGFVLIASLLEIIAPSLAIVWFLLIALGAVFFALNELNIFSLAKFLKSAPSQNVVAKHKPASVAQGSSRSKKIILLTNYDTEKVRKEETSNLFVHLGKAKFFELGGCALSLLGALISLFAGGNVLCTIFFVVGILASLLPILVFVLHTTAQYNEGANNNAASVAVMLEVAKRISTGVYAPAGEVPVIHGQRMAAEAGAIPADVNVSWETDGASEIAANSVVANMLFDKSRVGKTGGASAQVEAPLNEQVIAQSTPENMEAQQAVQGFETEGSFAPQDQQVAVASYSYEAPSTSAPEPAPQSASSAPDWFTRGKEKAADKGNQNAANVRRSSFGDAMIAAESRTADSQRAGEEAASNDLQKKLQAIHDQIESSSASATKHAETYAVVAENVLDNEIAQESVEVSEKSNEAPKQSPVQGVLKLETEQAPTEPSQTQDKNQPKTTDSATLQQDVPELKPLEPEYGLEVDQNEFLDKSKTEPLKTVKQEASEVTPSPKAHVQIAQERPVQTNDVVVPATSQVDAQQQQPTKTQAQVKAAPAAPQPKRRVSVPAEPAPQRNITLPSLTGALEANKINEQLKEKQRAEEERAHDAQRRLGVSLPSLTTDAVAGGSPASENKTVSNVSAFGVGEATGTFAPITDEDLARANEGEEDMYVYDADDAELQAGTTESGAVAGPGYVDIPDTHTESIFGKLFHKKKKDDESTFAESIGVDENWEARQVGKERGDWSSFDDDDWNGGAVFSGGETGQLPVADEVRDEIYNFATNDIGAEVWCVALGAECSNHSGLNKFLEDQKDELKGAKFITLDALGAGELAIVEKEGVVRPQSVPTRMKRHARDAAKSAGVSISSETMLWKETTSSLLSQKGQKYVHVAGFEGKKPALLSDPGDRSDAVEDETMTSAARLVMEIVRSL